MAFRDHPTRLLLGVGASLLLACNGGTSADGGEGLDASGGQDGSTDTDSAGDGGGSGDGGDDAGDFEWGEEREFSLRIDDTVPAPLQLSMQREEVAELFGDVAEEVLLLELDSAPLLTNTLDTIKSACGENWKLDNPDPQLDCSLTELGQSFMGTNGSWETSAEYALVRILTMTPANAEVAGTSVEGMEGLADFLSIGGGFKQILADTMAIERTEEFLTTDVVVESMKQNLIASHPNIGGEGNIPLTLKDALEDLAPLSQKYGAVGDHPGVLVSDFETHGEVFGPDFEMNAVAESNLRVLEGIDASVDKDYLSVIVDLNGPTFDDEAEFDFEDPEKFSITGLNPDPVVDLRFSVLEADTFIASCAGMDSCQANMPGNPVGSGSAWALDPWLLEYNIAYGGTLKYGGLSHELSWLLGLAGVQVGQNGDPNGWARFQTPLGLGDPPEDQYVWELINEVAQVNLHQTDFNSFPEGGADVAFTLEDVGVGITGEEAAEAVRPYLQDQSSAIAGYLLGDYKKNNGPVDFYYRRADDGVPTLFFAASSDFEDGAPYGWTSPGFFSSAHLEDGSKVSQTELPGVSDTEHEKLRLTPGEDLVFIEDDEGRVYRLRLVVPEGDPTEITVYVSERQ